MFGTVTRGLGAEGRSEELGLPTFPARDFVVAGGLTVAHPGVTPQPDWGCRPGDEA